MVVPLNFRWAAPELAYAVFLHVVFAKGLVSLSAGDLALHDRFIRNASRRLKTIASEQSRIHVARESVQAGLQRQERMMEVTKRQLGRVAKDKRAAEEKDQLATVLDALMTGGDASLAQGASSSLKRK